MRERLNLLLLVGILGSFAAGVLLFLFTGAPARLVGGLLVMVGLVAIIGARGAAAAATQPNVVRIISLGTRTKSGIRPTTIILWGSGVALVGLLQLLGF
jgi:hypothetical protein